MPGLRPPHFAGNALRLWRSCGAGVLCLLLLPCVLLQRRQFVQELTSQFLLLVSEFSHAFDWEIIRT